MSFLFSLKRPFRSQKLLLLFLFGLQLIFEQVDYQCLQHGDLRQQLTYSEANSWSSCRIVRECQGLMIIFERVL